MCFHTRIDRPVAEIETHYNVSRTEKGMELEEELLYHHSDGFKHQDFWVIPQESPKHITPMMWGMLPPWAKNENPMEDLKEIKGQGLNAQSEKLFTSKMYKPSSLKRRCVIPLTGFYEPHTCQKPKDYKVPFLFGAREATFLSLAGIYTVTSNKYVSFSLLTREAEPGSMYAQIHNKKNWQGQHRQIVPLADDQIEAWLSEKLTETDIDRIIHDNLPEDGLTAHPISKDIFSRTVSADYPGIEKLVDNPNLNLDYSQWA